MLHIDHVDGCHLEISLCFSNVFNIVIYLSIFVRLVTHPVQHVQRIGITLCGYLLLREKYVVRFSK
jgi:hypothetical protein